jgi:hypothetical protein
VVKFLQTLAFSTILRHSPAMRQRVIDRLLGRRRDRRLAEQLEHRFRAQLDARAEAAARMADDLRQP